jgi:hypothetical protein
MSPEMICKISRDAFIYGGTESTQEMLGVGEMLQRKGFLTVPALLPVGTE